MYIFMYIYLVNKIYLNQSTQNETVMGNVIIMSWGRSLWAHNQSLHVPFQPIKWQYFKKQPFKHFTVSQHITNYDNCGVTKKKLRKTMTVSTDLHYNN